MDVTLSMNKNLGLSLKKTVLYGKNVFRRLSRYRVTWFDLS